jgi:hypothetical protein
MSSLATAPLPTTFVVRFVIFVFCSERFLQHCLLHEDLVLLLPGLPLILLPPWQIILRPDVAMVGSTATRKRRAVFLLRAISICVYWRVILCPEGVAWTFK